MQLRDSKFREFGCVCPVLAGYNVDVDNPNEWAEEIIEPEDDCIMHGKFVSNGQSSSAEFRAIQ